WVEWAFWRLEEWNSPYSRNSAYVVLVATPEMPLMLTWAPRLPSRNSRLPYTGRPSRDRPAGHRASFILSKYSASSRSATSARRTAWPGRGGTSTSVSGSDGRMPTRVTETCAIVETDTGSVPSASRNTSEWKLAPSYADSMASTTP